MIDVRKELSFSNFNPPQAGSLKHAEQAETSNSVLSPESLLKLAQEKAELCLDFFLSDKIASQLLGKNKQKVLWKEQITEDKVETIELKKEDNGYKLLWIIKQRIGNQRYPREELKQFIQEFRGPNGKLLPGWSIYGDTEQPFPNSPYKIADMFCAQTQIDDQTVVQYSLLGLHLSHAIQQSIEELRSLHFNKPGVQEVYLNDLLRGKILAQELEKLCRQFYQ